MNSIWLKHIFQVNLLQVGDLLEEKRSSHKKHKRLEKNMAEIRNRIEIEGINVILLDESCR